VPSATCDCQGATCECEGATRECEGASALGGTWHLARGTKCTLAPRHPGTWHRDDSQAMIHLSVNVNKIATLRNSRGGAVPRVIDAVRVCLEAGVPGITVHPRADRRHITPEDVREIAGVLRAEAPGVEFNIEGDPRPDLLDLVEEIGPAQCTLVPVIPGEITSQAGWPAAAEASAGTRVSEASAGRLADDAARLPDVIRRLHRRGVRVSLFVDAEMEPIRWARSTGADRVELYTEPFARAFERGSGPAAESFARYEAAAKLAHSLGLGVNAGHDLDLGNLVMFRELPHLDEVSIGHAIVSRAVFTGLAVVVREYLEVLAPGSVTR
jgi:pyridoxine 5-phosphate synthase